jgi:hypothetical protein
MFDSQFYADSCQQTSEDSYQFWGHMYQYNLSEGKWSFFWSDPHSTWKTVTIFKLHKLKILTANCSKQNRPCIGFSAAVSFAGKRKLSNKSSEFSIDFFEAD